MIEDINDLEEDELLDEKASSGNNTNGVKSALKDILELSIYFLIVLAVSFFIVTFVGQRTVVDGSSMNPTLSDGDNLIVDKLSYRFGEPKRFDIIVFPYQHAERTYYIKRIIGLPGESVYIDDDGNIFINHEKLEENYGAEVIINSGLAGSEIILEDDEYFVMGDNRNNSCDSRDYMVGNIKKDTIIGKAFVRIYPFNQIGFIKK